MKNLLLFVVASFLFFQCKNDGASAPAAETSAAETNAAPASSPASAAQVAASQPAKPEPQRPAGQRTEIGNFEYWHYVKNDGPKPQPTQAVFYHYQMRRGGRVVQTNYGNTPSGGIIPTPEEAKSNPQALVEGLRLMAVGDSLTIVFPVGNNPDSSYVYDIVLRAIHNR
jgi:hypothetical protein